ncbi:MAG: hypothetical protein ACK5KQ_00075 [Anaerorhabdus sp.]
MNINIVRNKISIASLLITGIFFSVSGFLILLWLNGVPSMVKLMILLYCFILSIFGVISCLSKFKFIRFIQALIPAILGLNFYFNPTSLPKLYAFLMGIYISIIGVCKFIDFIILNANKNKGRYLVLISSMITFMFSVPLVLNPNANFEGAIILTAIFCIFHGLTYIGDFIYQIFPNKKFNGRKFRINLPIIFTSLLPKKAVLKINKLFESDEDKILFEESFVGDNKVDLEILIHATDKGFSSMGHVDLVFEDTVYGYGNYDIDSWKFFQSIGDGILLKFKGKKKYINFRMKDIDGSTFAYGIRLTDDEYQRVKKTLLDFEKHLVKWKCRYEKKINNEDIMGEPIDYLSRLYREGEMETYKFKDTSFKAYFVMSTNCVKLADKILRAADIVAATPNGILTPGAYLDFFNRQYSLVNSSVVSKKSYNPSGSIKHEKVIK